MNTAKLIGKNISCLAFAQLITMFASLVLVVFIARFLGDAEYGKLSFSQSFTSILVIFADCGLNVMSIREISKNKELAGKYLTNTLVIKLILAVITFVFICVIIEYMNYPKDTVVLVILIGISAIVNTFSQYLRSIFKAFEKIEYEALLNSLYTLILVSTSLLLLYKGFGLIEIAYVYVISELINFLLSLVVVVKKFTRPTYIIDFNFWKFLIKESLPFSMTMFVGIIYLRIDTVMLSMMKGDAVVGWYNAACTIMYSLLFIPNIAILSIFPLMSKCNRNPDDLKIIIEKSAKYLLIISLVITMVIFILSDEIIYTIYGEMFTNSSIVLKILCIYLPLRFINNVTGYTLASINKEPYHAFGGLIGACTNILLNLLLIPKYSFVGAAVATVITEVILFTVYNNFVARFFNKIPVKKLYLKPVISFLIVFYSFYFLDYNSIKAAFAAVVLYFVILYKINTFDKDDINIFHNVFGKPKDVK